jgi:uncharacterized membrane protein YesL
MGLVWRVVRLTVGDLVEEVFWLIPLNILWCILAVLVLPMPFATAGLARVAADIGEGKVISLRTFIEGGRRLWKPAYLWGLANLGVGAIIWLNFAFYYNHPAQWAAFARLLVVAVALWWVAIQFYTFPFLIVQEEPSLKMAYRNSMILIISQPVLAGAVFVVVVLLSVVSYLLKLFPLIVLYFVLLALLANRTVVETIKVQKEEETQGDSSR